MGLDFLLLGHDHLWLVALEKSGEEKEENYLITKMKMKEHGLFIIDRASFSPFGLGYFLIEKYRCPNCPTLILSATVFAVLTTLLVTRKVCGETGFTGWWIDAVRAGLQFTSKRRRIIF